MFLAMTIALMNTLWFLYQVFRALCGKYYLDDFMSETHLGIVLVYMCIDQMKTGSYHLASSTLQESCMTSWIAWDPIQCS